MARKPQTEPTPELPNESEAPDNNPDIPATDIPDDPAKDAEYQRLQQFRQQPKNKPAQTPASTPEPEPEPEPVQSQVTPEPEAPKQPEIDPKEIERLRREAASVKQLNQQLKDLKNQIAAFEREKLSEEEKREADYKAALARAQELENKLRSSLATQAIDQAALEAGVPVDKLPRIRKLLANSVEFDDENQATNAGELVKELVREIPEFVRQQVPVNPGNPASNRRGKSLTLEMLRTMSQDEIAKLDWGEVQKVLSSQTA